MIELWGRLNSANVQKVVYCLEEIKRPYTRHRVGGGFGGNREPDYLKMNPNGLVPVIRERETGLVLWESGAIVRHLCRHADHGAVWPGDPDLAIAEQWACWADTAFYPAMTELFFTTVRGPRDDQPSDAEIERMAAPLDRAIAMLDDHLRGRSYVSGDQKSFADFIIAPLARRALMLPKGRPEAPHVARWLDNLRRHASFQKIDAIPLGDCLEAWTEIEQDHG